MTTKTNSPTTRRPRLAVFKFASCDGCQLQLLSCEDELLSLAERIDIVHFLEASSRVEQGPYDVALVEGSISTPIDRARIAEVRSQSKILVTIGACATAGGIQALKNWSDCNEFVRTVYAEPQFISTLSTSTAISDHVKVDFELRGCPVDRHQLLEVINAFVNDREPKTPTHCVCLDCKRQGNICVTVTRDEPCLGPVTQAGCGAVCPKYDRGCYGCFGPSDQTNCQSLSQSLQASGRSASELVTLLRSFNADAPAFRDEGDRIDPGYDQGEAH